MNTKNSFFYELNVKVASILYKSFPLKAKIGLLEYSLRNYDGLCEVFHIFAS
jgi:hypothetical protein